MTASTIRRAGLISREPLHGLRPAMLGAYSARRGWIRAASVAVLLAAAPAMAGCSEKAPNPYGSEKIPDFTNQTLYFRVKGAPEYEDTLYAEIILDNVTLASGLIRPSNGSTEFLHLRVDAEKGTHALKAHVPEWGGSFASQIVVPTERPAVVIEIANHTVVFHDYVALPPTA